MKTIILTKNGVKVPKKLTLEECAILFEGAIKTWANEMYKIVKEMSNNLMEYDDFYSEGMVCLIRIYDRYTPKNTFNTALHKSLDNLKVDLIRKVNAKKRKTDLTVLSFDLEIENCEVELLQELYGEEDDNFKIIELREDISNAFINLTEEEKRIAKFLIENESTKRVLAKELNISRPTLDTKIKKVKDKIINLLPEYTLF